MATYPSSPKPQTITESFIKAQRRTPFEDGSVQSSVKHTRGRGKWELSYEEIFIEDVYTIKTFFYANQGTLFDWVNPMNSTTYSVRFSDDQLQATISSPRDCSMTVAIEEA
jgi:hypothetical protein